MISFFILPFNPLYWETAKSDLAIETDWYRSMMQQKWPAAKIYTPPAGSTYLLRWEINQDEFNITGGLQRDHQTVSFQPGFKLNLPTFVLWHREIIPEKFQLFLTWEGTWESMEIKSDTREQDIVAFTGLVN